MEEFNKVDLVNGEAAIRSDWSKNDVTGVISLTLKCFNTIFHAGQTYSYNIPEHYLPNKITSRLLVIPSEIHTHFRVRIIDETIKCKTLKFEPPLDISVMTVELVNILQVESGTFDKDFLLNEDETLMNGLYEISAHYVTYHLTFIDGQAKTLFKRHRKDAPLNLKNHLFNKYIVNKD